MIDKKQVIGMLKRRQGDRTLRELASEIGCSAPYLSDILHGNRNPGPKILDYLRLRREGMYHAETDE